MANDFSVIGLLDDLEDGIRFATEHNFSKKFLEKLQAVHDELVDISNRIEEGGDIASMNEMLEKQVEECFVQCRSGNQNEAGNALKSLESILKTF